MDSLNCISCGSPKIEKVGVDEYICASCGTRLRDNLKQQIIIQQGWLCTVCGFNNENQSIFCTQCGKN